MSNSRKQIEAWLQTISVEGDVLDVGGLFWPIKGRTKSWLVHRYHILDVKVGRKGVYADFIHDMNYPFKDIFEPYDTVFCIEATDHFWDPFTAFKNLAKFVKPKGKLYTSSNFIFPHHTGHDCLRLTKTGLQRLFFENGFNVIEIQPRFAVNNMVEKAMALESKVDYAKGEIGYMCKVQKL